MDSKKPDLLSEFDTRFRSWVKTACEEWDYSMPSEEYFHQVYQRLPEGLRTLLGYGLKNKLITQKGKAFTLIALPSNKGPYNWFSHNRTPKPAPNWEYFVQVAEFVRFYMSTSTKNNLSLTFEDGLMDIGIYKNNKLLIYCEVKEKASQLEKLVREIKKLQANVDLRIPDRSNDPLRKAKYLIKHKPKYLIASAIGARFEYKVVYLNDTSFELIRDIVPLV